MSDKKFDEYEENSTLRRYESGEDTEEVRKLKKKNDDYHK